VRILLVALNARYVHTNLAVRYLQEALREQKIADVEVCIREFTINEQIDYIAAEIYEEKPDAIGFSCYIWNMSQIGALIQQLHLVLPQTYLMVGGPEVTFDPEHVLTEYPQLNAVVVGEGEESVPALIQAWAEGRLPVAVKGIVWRSGDQIVFNQRRLQLPDLDQMPNPYPGFEDFNGRLVYVETARGCPFNCAFCISSTFCGIRYLEPERFREVLRQLFSNGAQTIKFVDRTFNADKKHAFRILDIFREEANRIIEAKGADGKEQQLRAHCEMAGELLDEEWLAYLENFPAGMIQLEIGVQSTHQPTLEVVRRPQHFAKWKDKVRFLQHQCDIPIHLDLIAGLPLEGWEEFRNSFNQVLAVEPGNLQLGFLKVLKGSAIWEKSSDYGLVYAPVPPYTILQTNELSYPEIRALVRVEEILEKYYNSGRFAHSMGYLLQNTDNPFAFFHSFATYWHDKGWFRRAWNSKALFQNLWAFIEEHQPIIGQRWIWRERIRFDYFLMERPGVIPEYMQDKWTGKKWDKMREEIRKDSSWIEKIPDSAEMDRRQWARATAVAYFQADIPVLDKQDRLIKGNTDKKDQESEKEPKKEQKQERQETTLETNEQEHLEKGAWYLFYYRNKKTEYYRYEEKMEPTNL